MEARAKERLVSLNDRKLAPLITAPDDASRTEQLERLIVEIARPISEKVIARFSDQEWSIRREEVDDIIANISLRLLRKLQVVPLFEEESIERFEDYVDMLAQHSVYDFLRRRFPERSRLRQRLRYLLGRDRNLASWTTSQGTACGFRKWSGRNDLAETIWLPQENVTPRMLDASRPAEAIAAILKQVGRPLRLEALVALLADLWNVSDESVLAPVEAPRDLEPARFETRQSLQILWEEIQALPPLQRKALLLNLREPGGVNAIALFIMVGIASIDAIASAIDLTAQELAEIWNRLPLDDLTVAHKIGVTRQQVINLRKTARERLARRLIKRSKGRST